MDVDIDRHEHEHGAEFLFAALWIERKIEKNRQNFKPDYSGRRTSYLYYNCAQRVNIPAIRSETT